MPLSDEDIERLLDRLGQPPIRRHTVTPLNPLNVSFDQHGEQLHYVYLECFGINMGASPYSLADQYNNNRVHIFRDGIESPPPSSGPSEYWRYSGAIVVIRYPAGYRRDPPVPHWKVRFHVFGETVGSAIPRAAFYVSVDPTITNLEMSREVRGMQQIEVTSDPPVEGERMVVRMYLEGRARLYLKGVDFYISAKEIIGVPQPLRW